MKKLLLAIVLVLAMAIPAFAQNGPLKIKPLMLYTYNNSNDNTPWFSTYEAIHGSITFEVKGTGTLRVRPEIRNSAGVLIDKTRTDPLDVNNSAFAGWTSYFSFGDGVSEGGYYTIKITYVDAATGKTWSHQTKISAMGY